jgi:hypothetical protein
VVTTAQFSPDGKRIIAASKDGTARIWDAQTGKPLTNGTIQVWHYPASNQSTPRYRGGTPDNMPIVGGDNFKVLQDQIDALEKRVKQLETKACPPGH